MSHGKDDESWPGVVAMASSVPSWDDDEDFQMTMASLFDGDNSNAYYDPPAAFCDISSPPGRIEWSRDQGKVVHAEDAGGLGILGQSAPPESEDCISGHVGSLASLSELQRCAGGDESAIVDSIVQFLWLKGIRFLVEDSTGNLINLGRYDFATEIQLALLYAGKISARRLDKVGSSADRSMVSGDGQPETREGTGGEVVSRNGGYRDTDYLFGSGAFTNNHLGNVKFREEVNARKGEYQRSRSSEKGAIIKAMMQGWAAQGRRFLEKDESTLWIEARPSKVEQVYRRLFTRKDKERVTGAPTSSSSQETTRTVPEPLAHESVANEGFAGELLADVSPKTTPLSGAQRAAPTASGSQVDQAEDNKVDAKEMLGSFTGGAADSNISLRKRKRLLDDEGLTLPIETLTMDRKPAANTQTRSHTQSCDFGPASLPPSAGTYGCASADTHMLTTLTVPSLSTYPLQNSSHPQPHDVLSGRRGEFDCHIGNQHWWMLVRSNVDRYKALDKTQKLLLSRSIVEAIRIQIPPGRFLKKDSATKLWYEIGNRRALAKTLHALQEAAAAMQSVELASRTRDDSDGDSDEADESRQRQPPFKNRGTRGSGSGSGSRASGQLVQQQQPSAAGHQVSFESPNGRLRGTLELVFILAIAACHFAKDIGLARGAILTWIRALPSAVPPTAGSSPALRIKQLFRRVLPLDTLDSLQDTSSPQCQAFEWATEVDQLPWMESSGNKTLRLARMKQRFALATLHYATGGPWTWISSSGWLNATVHECDWFGCSCRPSEWRVDSIDLHKNGLNGSLPREAAMLRTLDSLKLSKNYLKGPIPTNLGRISSLTTLDLSSNLLSSSLPSELGQLLNLKHFNLSDNELTGIVPPELDRLPDDAIRDLSFNPLAEEHGPDDAAAQRDNGNADDQHR